MVHMKTGHEIIAMQNSCGIIELLAAQRQMHSDAKVGYIAYGIASIGIPVIAALLPNAPAYALVLSVVVPVILGRLISDWADSRQVEAASVQQFIDATLFGIEFPHDDYEKSLAARRSKSHIQRHGSEGLKDWYPDRIRGLPAGEAEYECQGINIGWTRDLAIVTLLLDCAIGVALIMVAVRCIQLSGVDSLKFVLLTPAIEWLAETMFDRYKLLCAASRIKNSREDLGNSSEESVTEVQKLIYACRCLRPVPDFLYALTKDSEQEKADSRL